MDFCGRPLTAFQAGLDLYPPNAKTGALVLQNHTILATLLQFLPMSPHAATGENTSVGLQYKYSRGLSKIIAYQSSIILVPLHQAL